MKQKLLFVFSTVMICQLSIAQCEFDRDEFDDSNQISIVETKLEKIYHRGKTADVLKIGMGNNSRIKDYVKIVAIVSDRWEVSPENRVSIVLNNNQTIELNPESDITSETDFIEVLGVLAATPRQAGTIICPIDSLDLNKLYANDIIEISIEFSYGIKVFDIKKKKQSKHVQLIDCLDRRAVYWEDKVPGLIATSNKIKARREEEIKDRRAKEKEAKEMKAKEREEAYGVNAQEPEIEEVFKVVEQMPRFPGCENELGDNKAKRDCADQKMKQYIYSNLKYPPQALQEKLEGMVVIQFVVDKKGNITQSRIVREIGLGCGEEALRVVESMNELPEKWTPGFQRNRNEKVLYTLPVRFRLPR